MGTLATRLHSHDMPDIVAASAVATTSQVINKDMSVDTGAITIPSGDKTVLIEEKEVIVDILEVVQATGQLCITEVQGRIVESITTVVGVDSNESALAQHQEHVRRVLKQYAKVSPRFEDITFRSGHVHNLTSTERIKLQQLWLMVLEHLNRNSGDEDLKGNALIKIGKELEVKISSQGISNVEDMIAGLKDNPLMKVIWNQMSTESVDSLFLRFLRARSWNLPESFAMLTECLQWHRTFGVHDLLKAGEPSLLPYLLECGKHYWWNVDIKGRLVLWISTRLHDRNKQTLEENMRATVYLIEQARRLMAPGTETVTLIFDLSNAPLASFDVPSIQFTIQILQNYYPECLGKCYVVDAPWIFNGIFKIVKTFLDPVVAAKIRFIKNSELINFIHPELVPKRFPGGQDDFVYEYEKGGDDRVIRKLKEGEIDTLTQEIESLQFEYLKQTIEESPVSSFGGDSHRSAIRAKLHNLSRQLEWSWMPPCYHHRMDVIDSEDDCWIDWLRVDRKRFEGKVDPLDQNKKNK